MSDLDSVPYSVVRESLDTTELGYTLASLDRWWTVFMVDQWAEEGDGRGERLYFQGLGITAYEMWDDELCWRNRHAAQVAAEVLEDNVVSHWEKLGSPDPRPRVFVINIGDDSRAEARWMDSRVGILKGKFRGSDDALAELAKMRLAR